MLGYLIISCCHKIIYGAGGDDVDDVVGGDGLRYDGFSDGLGLQ